jgi:hypothetical protein
MQLSLDGDCARDEVNCTGINTNTSLQLSYY